MMSTFLKLQNKNKEDKFICVGLDTDPQKLPLHFKKDEDSILEFNKSIIEATLEFAAAYKINFAFYEKFGSEGLDILKQTVGIIPNDILKIGDAKRGDIGNTSRYYAESLFDYYGFDSTTINPYMGEDSVKPFLEYSDKLIFILALTSNPGANDLEKLQLKDEKYVFQKVIEKVKLWNKDRNCGIVFGATNLKELQENIKEFGNLPVLLPGVGAQGGNFEEVMSTFIEQKKLNLLVNVSRGIIYKDNTSRFAKAAAEEIIRLNKIVKRLISK
jgi:orotidine-5'-phosphate decarboxylase